MVELKTSDNYSVIYQIVGERIRELRERNNESQLELAKRIGISRSSISNIESGRQPVSLNILYEIAVQYNSDVFTLLPSLDQISHILQTNNNKITDLLDKADVGLITRQQILNLIK